MQEFESDYLIVGSGAMGMAFADVIFNETQATVTLVDKHHQPGGHWNQAYGYVRLHQPSAFYGVNSKALGSDQIDGSGWNKGLYELATSGEVCAYFDQLMQQQFLPSGRVQYFPMCEYTGDGEFRSLVSAQTYRVKAKTHVDATYMNVTVPSMRPPPYEVADGVNCEAPNLLPQLAGQYSHYNVVGAGKTGMDACLFLLRNGVDPNCISWVMPRDSWLLDRANIQPGHLFAQSIGRLFALQAETMANAGTLETLFQNIANTGQLLRLDETIEPTMYRCATVTKAELEQLRRIKQIIRMGRVTRLSEKVIELEQGQVATHQHTLHIDCTADGLQKRPPAPIFNQGQITLQSVRTCQQVFSAAFIAHVEGSYADDQAKNALCGPVPHPDNALDFLRTNIASAENAARWSADPELTRWLKAARLDGFSNANAPDPDPQDPEVALMIETQQRANQNVRRLLESV